VLVIELAWCIQANSPKYNNFRQYGFNAAHTPGIIPDASIILKWVLPKVPGDAFCQHIRDWK